MTAVIEALPSLGMEAAIQRNVQDLAHSIVAQLRDSRPDRSRLQSALAKLRDLLGQAGNQAISAVMSAAIDYERAKLGLPPGG
jgi:hypothetical protein